MTDTFTTTQAAVAAEAQHQAAAAAVEQTATTILQVYLQEGAAAVAASQRAKILSQTAARAILDACRTSMSSAVETAGDPGAVGQVVRETLELLEPDYAEKVVDGLTEAVISRADRIEEDEDTADARRSWTTSVGRTLSGRLASEASLALVKPVEEQLGTKLRKLWMSRADSRVRGSHRKLHGTTAALDKPFWRELGTGKVLGFPGDPRAPLEQTIGCRCFLWYVPANQAAEAEKTFHLPDSEFELVAGGHAHGSIYELEEVVIAAAFDVSLGMVAAEQRKYDEEKHKRDATGKFAKKTGGTAEEQRRRPSGFDYEAWKARGGWDAVLRRYPSLNKGKGGRKKAASDGRADELRRRQEAERENQAIRREQMREERRQNTEARRVAERRNEARLRGERLTQDEAIMQREDDIRENERELRNKQRDVQKSSADLARSEGYIRQMRLRGESPEVIEAERQRLAGLKTSHSNLQREERGLADRSKLLGTTDEVRALRDRVALSRRAEDDVQRTSREDFDAAIRLQQAEQDRRERERERTMRERQRQEREALRGAGSPSSALIALLPVGDREITYADGDRAPMHLTLAYMGDADNYDKDDIDRFDKVVTDLADEIPPFTAKVAGHATLGEDGDTVCLVESDDLADCRDWVMSDAGLRKAVEGASTHPHWIPHVTGLDDANYEDEVEFDRVALWAGDQRREYPLRG